MIEYRLDNGAQAGCQGRLPELSRNKGVRSFRLFHELVMMQLQQLQRQQSIVRVGVGHFDGGDELIFEANEAQLSS